MLALGIRPWHDPDVAKPHRAAVILQKERAETGFVESLFNATQVVVYTVLKGYVG